MRLDKNDRSISAAQILNWYSEKSLQQLFQQVIATVLFTPFISKFGQITNSISIARAISMSRAKAPIETTDNLLTILSPFAPKNNVKLVAKVFQCLRMAANNDVLKYFEVLSFASLCFRLKNSG